MVRDLIEQLAGLQNRVRRGHAVNVNDRQTKDDVIALASTYFSSCRKVIADALGENEMLLAHDQRWQDLIRLAHGNSTRATYLKAIHRLQQELAELNIACLSRFSEKPLRGDGLSDLTPAEGLIIRTLEKFVPSAAASYRQAILDLRAERLSYRGTASELRESLRETLDYLAPDEDVSAQPGFSLEDGQGRPTMKQKAQYILAGRGRAKAKRATAEKSIELIDGLTGEIARAVYNQASLATHVETSRAEVMKVKRYVDTVFLISWKSQKQDRSHTSSALHGKIGNRHFSGDSISEDGPLRFNALQAGRHAAARKPPKTGA